MSNISPRQKQILYYLSLEQIKQSEPVASNQIKEKYNLKFSPATIRNELLRLCQLDYLEQPHTSAGRILSDFGWEMLIANFLENVFEEKSFIPPGDFNLLVKALSEKTNAFSFAFDFMNDELYYFGFSKLLNEKIINNLQELSIISRDIDNLKEKLKKVKDVVVEEEINVFIGKKNPLFKTSQLSLIATRSGFNNIILGIIVSKVTDYEKHFKIFKNLINHI